MAAKRGLVIFWAVVLIGGLILLSSLFTILSINAIFGKEIIELTLGTVFGLAWLKFVVAGMFSGIVKVVNER